MDEEIIKRFDLTETDLCFGNSFSNNIKVYRYKDDIVMAKCNEMGEPARDILTLNTVTKNKIFFTEEFLKGQPIEILNNLINA